MKKLFIALLVLPLAMRAMEPEVRSVKEMNLVEHLLTQEETDWETLPGELSHEIARYILDEHPAVRYLLSKVSPTFKTLEGHTAAVTSAQFNGASDKVVTASHDETAKIWDIETSHCLATLEGQTKYVYSAQFNGAGDKVVMASDDRTAKIWDVETGYCLTTLKGHTRPVNSAQFNGSGDKVVTGSYDRTTKIWDVKTGHCQVTLEGHTDYVSSAQFNGAGDKVVTASDDGTAKIWDVETGYCLTTLEDHTHTVNSAQFNGAGDKVVTASFDTTAKIWDVKTGHCLVTLKDKTHYSLLSAQFNGAGDKVVTGSYDRTARIWDIRPLWAVPYFLSKEVTLQHAFILHAVYEVMIARTLVKKHGAKAFEEPGLVSRLVSSLLKRRTTTPEDIRLDITKCPHLEKYYNGLPESIQMLLYPYITK